MADDMQILQRHIACVYISNMYRYTCIYIILSIGYVCMTFMTGLCVSIT